MRRPPALPLPRPPSLLALAMAMLLSMNAMAATAPAPQRAFGPAEMLAYDCKYLGLSVGKLQVMVGSAMPMHGKQVWPIMGMARTDPLFVLFPVKDKYISWWSPESRSTLGTDLVAEEKNKRRRERVRFLRADGKAVTTREKEDGPPRESTYDNVPVETQDILAGLFTLRERPLAIGDVEEIPIFTGARVFVAKAEVEKKERIEVAAGTYDTVLVKLHVQFSGSLASKRELRVFFTDDARHVPVRLDGEFLLGTVVADLTSYQPGITR